MERIFSWKTRRWIYGIALAVLPLLTFYGIISETAAPLWAAIVGAILVPSLALVNTDEHSDTVEPRRALEE